MGDSSAQDPVVEELLPTGSYCLGSMSRSTVFLICLAELLDAKTIWEVGQHQGHIEIQNELPTPEEFFKQYVKPPKSSEYANVGKPVLWKGAAKKMPAFNLWTDEYLMSKHGKTKMDQVETELKE